MKTARTALSLASLALLATGAAPGLGQTVLYSNAGPAPASGAGLSTGATTVSGVAAPNGLVWSETPSVGVAQSGAVAGFAGFAVGAGHYRFADDFTIPAGTGGWVLSSATLYAYVSGDPAPAQPFESVNVRVWSGSPDLPGSFLLAGDTGTNALSGVSLTNMRRVFSTAAVTGAPAPASPIPMRPIYALTVTLPGMVLLPGTYWLDWQINASGNVQSFVPPVTIVGQRGKTGANALQMRLAPPPTLVDTWLPLLDLGKPASAPDVAQDLPFLISGTIRPSQCGGSDVAGAGQTIGPDSLLTADDIIVYLNWYFSNDPRANVSGPGQNTSVLDSELTADDIIVFLGRFFAGC